MSDPLDPFGFDDDDASSAPIDEEEKTVREDGPLAVPTPGRTMIGPAVVRGGPSLTPIWQPPGEAGALVRAPLVPLSRPGSQRSPIQNRQDMTKSKIRIATQ